MNAMQSCAHSISTSGSTPLSLYIGSSELVAAQDRGRSSSAEDSDHVSPERLDKNCHDNHKHDALQEIGGAHVVPPIEEFNALRPRTAGTRGLFRVIKRIATTIEPGRTLAQK